MPPTKTRRSAPDDEIRGKTSQTKATAIDDFPIVGIGASAGGLETLQAFFSRMPADANIAFVIIQHLSAQHKSMMAELLSKHTHLGVNQIEEGMLVSPNCVYLAPPDKNVGIFNRRLHLVEPVKNAGINLPIDFFFRSLSDDQKEKAIGIIVSGTASDGTLGIKAIKDEGGMTMVQDPATAKYDGMPTSAIATGRIDFVVPVEKMPQTLLEYIRHPFSAVSEKTRLSESGMQHQLDKICALIRNTTGHDFSKYKLNTVQRRIERRMAVHRFEKPSDYVTYLQKNPDEKKALFKDLLIGVTNFFRDPQAFETLAREGIEKLLRHKEDGQALRCWVAGCATGEEAYSVAILIAEAMEKLHKRLEVEIFASDIDEAAIETAREGLYPENIAADVSEERLKRFFTKDRDVYKAEKQIRDMIIFSTQSIIKDPPFSKLDLVSCRNLLIYMDPSLHKKIIPMLHYALKPNGILFLGTAETIGGFNDLFQPLDSKWKIYERKQSASGHHIHYPAAKGVRDPRPSPEAPETRKKTDLHALAERMVLERFSPAAVLVDAKYDILHFVGRTEKYLTPPVGEPRFNLPGMARPDVKLDLTAALHYVTQTKKPTSRKGLRIQHDGNVYITDLSVIPVGDKNHPSGLLLAVFEDKTAEHPGNSAPPEASKTKHGDADYRQLEHELQSTREYLQATIEELETSNEELKSTNEEMQSVNEELQSTNEELETSKEELQSTNEELNTVNAELQNKVHELSKAGDDMNNLMAAADIASIFLDTDLCIQRYTPTAARIIKLIPSDIGRPLSDLKTSFLHVDLAEESQRVLDNLNTREIKTRSEGHVWYQLKVMPYRTMDNVIDGVVLTLIDIQQQIGESEDKIKRLATVLEDSNDAVMVQDFNGRILTWNKGAEKMYGWTQAEALEMNAAELIPTDKEQEFHALIDKLKKGEDIQPLKTRRKTKSGRTLDIWLTATLLTDESGRPVEIATTERDLAWLSRET